MGRSLFARLLHGWWGRPEVERAYISFEPPSREQLTALVPQPAHSFRHLPIIAADVDDRVVTSISNTPGLYLHKSDDPAYLRILRSMDAALEVEQPTIINISLSPPVHPFHQREPMNLASHILARAGHVVVVAAGNDGPQEGSLSAWSVAPWVIGVGASDDHGERLLSLSSIGLPDDTFYQPTVVAPGRTIVPLREGDDEHGTMVGLVIIGKEGGGRALPGYRDVELVGTSVSAPRVTRICGFIQTLLRIVLVADRLLYHKAGGTLGNPDSVASACATIVKSVLVQAPDLPLLDAMPTAALRPILEMLTGLSSRGVNVFQLPFVTAPEVPFPVSVMKSFLRDMARAMPGHRPHEVGSGFVSEAIAVDYFLRLTPADFLRHLFGSNNLPCDIDFCAPGMQLVNSQLLAAIMENKANMRSYKVL